MTAELTTEEVILFIDNKNLRLWTNVLFYTEVEGTSEVAEVTKIRRQAHKITEK